MNHISEIIIENFQSHKKTTIQLAGPGKVTAIIGPSDSGKSAVLKALKWVFFNQPEGTDHFRAGTEFCRVTVRYVNGTAVIRERNSASINKYEIIIPGEKNEILTGFGKSVPQRVQEITGIKPVKIGDKVYTLNIAGQLEGPFLGKDTTSGTDRARILDKLSGIEEVSIAGKLLASKLYQERQEMKREVKNLAEQETKLEQYDYLEELKAKIDVTNCVIAGLTEVTEKRNKLTELKRVYNDTLRNLYVEQHKQSDLAKFIGHTLPIIEAIEHNFHRWCNLSECSEVSKEVKQSLTIYQRIIERTTFITAASFSLDEITPKTEKLNNLHTLGKRMMDTDRELIFARETLEVTKDIDAISIKIHETESKMERSASIYGLRSDRGLTLKRLEIAHKTLEQTEFADNTATIIDNIMQLIKHKDTLIGLSLYRETTKKDLNSVRLDRQYFEQITNLEPKITEIEDKFVKLAMLKPHKESITFFKVSLDKSLANFHKLNSEVHARQDNYIELLREHKQCPTCGGEVNPERIKEVI